MRNFVLSNDGRTVYAYPNVDIHFGSFVAQELVILGFCLLLAVVWLDWIEQFAIFRELPPVNDKSHLNLLSGRVVRDLSSALLKWQIASVVLAFGFLPFTNFFWTLVEGYRDQRYFLSAVVAHGLWALSWSLISLPVLERWRAWKAFYRQAVAQLAADSATIEERRFKMDMIVALQPLSTTYLSLSGATAAVSFVLPIVQLFMK